MQPAGRGKWLFPSTAHQWGDMENAECSFDFPTQYEMDINNLRATEMIGELEYILCKERLRYLSLLKLETRGET